MDAVILSDNEIYLLSALRSLKPFERIEIIASPNGDIGDIIIHRSTKVSLKVGFAPKPLK